MEPLILVGPAIPPAYAASASDSAAAAAGASSGDAKTQGATKKKRKRGPRAAGADADADGVDGGGGGGERSNEKKKKAEAAASASEGKGATAGGGKRGAAASAKADGKQRQQQEEKQQQQQQEEKREPGILAPQYAPKRQDLGADHEAIFALIKAVVKLEPHGFVALQFQAPQLPRSLYSFVRALLGDACLGKRRPNEAGFWLSLTKMVNRLEVEDPGHLRFLLGALRWQRANRPSTFTLLIPRPRGPSVEAADGHEREEHDADDSESEDDAAEDGSDPEPTSVEEVDVQATFPVGITLAEPRRARRALRAAVLRLTGGAATKAQQWAAWGAYRALWGSHAPVPLKRVPFMRFDKGIQVQRALRLTGMGDPIRRRALQEEVKGMDTVGRMLLPVTASLLRDGRLPVLVLPGEGEGGKGAATGGGAKREGKGKGKAAADKARPRAKEEEEDGADAATGAAGRKTKRKKGGKDSHEVAMIMIGMESQQSRQKRKRGGGAGVRKQQQQQQQQLEEREEEKEDGRVGGGAAEGGAEDGI